MSDLCNDLREEIAELRKQMGISADTLAEEEDRVRAQAAHIARLTSALKHAPVVALEQRCERGTPWDRACVAIAAKMNAHVDATLEALRHSPLPEGNQDVRS